MAVNFKKIKDCIIIFNSKTLNDTQKERIIREIYPMKLEIIHRYRIIFYFEKWNLIWFKDMVYLYEERSGDHHTIGKFFSKFYNVDVPEHILDWSDDDILMATMAI